MVPLILASASPRRADLLRSAGFAFTVRPMEVDETPLPGEPASDYVLRVARDKARAAAATPEGAAGSSAGRRYGCGHREPHHGQTAQ